MAARRGLVADESLLPRADRHVPESARPRGARASSSPAPRPRRSRPRSSAKLNGLRDEETKEVGDPRGVRSRRSSTPGRTSKTHPTSSSATTPAIATSWDCATGVVAGPVFEDNVKAVERRPLHRSAARAGRVLLQPVDRRPRIRRSSTSRRRRCGCSASSRRRTWTGGALGGTGMSARSRCRRSRLVVAARAASRALRRRCGRRHVRSAGAGDRARLRRPGLLS